LLVVVAVQHKTHIQPQPAAMLLLVITEITAPEELQAAPAAMVVMVVTALDLDQVVQDFLVTEQLIL
jgi:hypothetical protein